MNAAASRLAKAVWTSFGGQESAASALSFTGAGDLPSAYAVTDFASVAIAAAALAIAELVGRASAGMLPAVTVDRRLASFWFGGSIHPIGWKMPAAWDPIAGDYRATDGWIRLHTNAPRHRAAGRSRRCGDAVGLPRPKARLGSGGVALKALAANRARAIAFEFSD